MVRKKNLNDLNLYAMASARLHSQGLSQTQVAAQLEISQSEVSRLLKTAVDNKWLTLEPTFRGAEEANEIWLTTQERFFRPTSLGKQLKECRPTGDSLLQRVHVVYVNPEEDLGRSAVAIVEELVGRASVVGVTWGRTISKFVTALGAHRTGPWRQGNPVQFVPLCGEPLKERRPVRYSSSALVEQFDRLINGRQDAILPSLIGVPAFIPLTFDDKQAMTVRQFIHLMAGYCEIFGNPKSAQGHEPGLATTIDTLITSVGVAEGTRRGIFLSERVKLGDISEDAVHATISGDVGGIIIPKRGIAAAAEKKIEKMNARWTGVTADQLKSCAARAVRERKPGVVMFAVGRRRKEIVARILEENLVNELIVDHELAQELQKLNS